MSEPEFIYVTCIETTPDKLWQALTDGNFTERYWFGAHLRSDWKVGSSFEMVRSDGPVSDAGKVVECDPRRRLAYTFVNLSDKSKNAFEKLGPTRVTYEIEPAGDAIRLTMTEAHDRPLSDDILSGGRQGWPAILSSLKSLLETGKALVIKMEPPQRMLAALQAMGIETP